MPRTASLTNSCDCVTLFPMVLKQIVTKFLPIAAGLLLPGYLAAQGPQFNIQDLGTLPNLPACNGTALSQSGSVAGYCTSQPGQDLLINAPTTHVFLYANGAIKDLNISSPASAFPTGINNFGAVVGGSLTGAALSDLSNIMVNAAPFIYMNGTLQPIPDGFDNVLPLALNNAWQSAATTLSITPGSLNFFAGSDGFLLPVSGTMASIDLQAPGGIGTNAALGINSNGTIAGGSIEQGSLYTSPVIWQNSTPLTPSLLSNYKNAIATSVNDSGVAAGAAFNINLLAVSDPNANAHAVLFNADGSVTDLGVLPGDANSMATGINNAGSVVGFSTSTIPTFTLHLVSLLSPPSNKYHAFLYSGGKMYDLNNQLVNGSGWQLSYATQINNAGQIVGTGLINGGQHAFLLTPLVSSPSIENVVGAAFSTPAVSAISSNGVFTIFGTQLAAAPQALSGSDIVNNQLPTQLGGTCVESGTTKWNLFYVSPTQLNVLAGEVPSSGSIPVKVVTNCGTANAVASAEMNVPVSNVSPEFLYFLQTKSGVNPVAAVEATTGAYVGPPGLISGATFAPAHAGDVLTAYGVGWGTTDPPATIGTLAPGIASLPAGSYSLTLGGKTAEISYIGLSPGSAGLYQLNFTVPSGLPAGNQPLVLTVQGVITTSSAYIAVAN